MVIALAGDKRNLSSYEEARKIYKPVYARGILLDPSYITIVNGDLKHLMFPSDSHYELKILHSVRSDMQASSLPGQFQIKHNLQKIIIDMQDHNSALETSLRQFADLTMGAATGPMDFVCVGGPATWEDPDFKNLPAHLGMAGEMTM